MDSRPTNGIFLPICALICAPLIPPLGFVLGLIGVIKSPIASKREHISVCALLLSTIAALAIYYYHHNF